MATLTQTSAWDLVVGQDEAVRVLRASAASPVHSYLVVGPDGSGTRELGQALAAALVCPDGGCGECWHCQRTIEGTHPDVSWVERTRATLRYRAESGSSHEWTVERVIRDAALAPSEARRRVFVVPELTGLQTEAVPALLKTVEEPPASTVFVLLASSVPPDLVTVASRCLRVDVGLPDRDALVAHVAEHTDLTAESAAEVVALAGGRMDRALLLAGDDDVARRLAAYAEWPTRLDGTGSAAARVVDELVAVLDDTADRLHAEAHDAERQRLAADIKTHGLRASLLDEMEHRHRQERRRTRRDELEVALGVMLGAYRDAAVAGRITPQTAAEAVAVVQHLTGYLERNPNERLQLERTMLHMPPLSVGR